MSEEEPLGPEGGPTWDQKVVRLNLALAERDIPYAFGGATIPVLSIEDLLICKALFDRAKDWVDIEAVARTRRGDLDRSYISGWLDRFLPADDPRRERIAAVLD